MTIRIIRRDPTPQITTPFLRGLLRIICAGLDCPDSQPPDLSLFLLDDQRIRRANLLFREKDKATDVLSFSQLEGPTIPQMVGQPQLWGDILISTETALRAACERNVGLHEEIARLTIHGVLHLLGHDHVRGGKEAKRMKCEEKRLFELIRELKGLPFS